jgi:DNA repair protein RadC
MAKLKPFALVRYQVIRETIPPDAWLVAEGQQDGWQPHSSYSPITTPEQGVKLFRFLIPDDGKEHFWMLGLSVRHKPLLAHEVSVGCMTSSLVHPRELFRPAILGGCAALLIAHNHPSGDPEPSAEDLSLTRRLASAGTLLGIELLDHLILGDGGMTYISLKQRGVF